MAILINYKDFQSGVYLLVGGQGTGKTSLAVAIARHLYKYCRKKDYNTSKEYIDNLNNSREYNLKLSKHSIYTNFDMQLDRRGRVHSHYIDTTCFGLPNSEYEVVHFPFGSTIIIDEADVILSCKDMKFRRYIVNLLKYARHNGLRVILISQRLTALQKRVRELVQYVFFCNEQKVSSFFGFVYRIKWRLTVLDNFARQLLEIKKECGCEITKKEMKQSFVSCKYSTWGNVFKRYDSYVGRAYFLKDLKQFEYIPQPIFEFNKKSIDNYCKMHPLVDTE